MKWSDMPWITDGGTAEDAAGTVRRYAAPEDRIVAYYADGFAAGYADRLEALLAGEDRLLELRLFSETRELWLHRSRLGEPFAWRVASEAALPDKERYCFETRQLLDLREGPEAAPELDAAGLRVLRPLNGRRFALPCGGADRFVRLMNYVRYDAEGVANAADWRLIGFAKEGL